MATKKKKSTKKKPSLSLVLEGQVYIDDDGERAPIDGKLVLEILLLCIKEQLDKELAR